jgi:Outer membrane protein beta-barrel domain
MNFIWTMVGISPSCGIWSLYRAARTSNIVPAVCRHSQSLQRCDNIFRFYGELSAKPRMRAILHQITRAATVTVFAVAFAIGLHAQQSTATAVAASKQYPTLNIQTELKLPVNMLDSDCASSRSSTDTTDEMLAERVALTNDLQPPPRHSYGHPHYTDGQHNADGSNKYTFLIGGGFTLPTGGTHNDLAISYNIQGGVGRNFNRSFGVIAQIDWANFGIQSNTLNNLLTTYNSIGAVDQNGNPLSQLGGSSHVGSLTLNPIYNFAQSETRGVYVVGGFGFYHKTANFTIPSLGTYCDPYYGCYQFQANQSIDKYTSNAFGVNAGVGFTYKPSRFASARLYVEARYVFVDNQPRPYSLGSATNSYFNVFPQNSARTTYIPVTLGVRF